MQSRKDLSSHKIYKVIKSGEKKHLVILHIIFIIINMCTSNGLQSPTPTSPSCSHDPGLGTHAPPNTASSLCCPQESQV